MERKRQPRRDQDGGTAQRVCLVVLVLAVLISCYPFVAPGHPITFDVWPHFTRQTIVYQALKEGFSPFHTFMFYSGYPHLRFYSPLFHMLGGALGFLTGGNNLLALRILLILIQVLSAGAMYWFLQRRTRDVQSAALGTLVYVLTPWRVRHIPVLANFPMALLYLLLPLMFLVMDRLIERPRFKTSLLLGLLIGLAFLSHIVYAAFGVLFLVVAFLSGYGKPVPGRAGRIERHRDMGKSRSQNAEPQRLPPDMRSSAFVIHWSRLKYYLLAGLAALGLAAFFIVPFLAEYRGHVYPKLLMCIPGPDLLVFLGLKSRAGGYAGGYFGLSIVVLVVIAAVSVFFRSRSARRVQVPVLVMMAVCLALAFVVPLLGKSFAFLTLGLLPERLLLFFVFFASGLVASAWLFLKSRIGFLGRRPVLFFCILLIPLASDCLPAHLRVRYPTKEEFLAGKPELYEYIAGRRPGKVLDLSVLVDRIDEPIRIQAYPAMGFLFGGLATPLGPQYHQFAPKSMAYVYPWVNQVAAELADTTSRVLALNSLNALALLGVSHLIIEPRLVTVEQEGVEHDALLVKEGIDWNTRFVEPERKPWLVCGATGAGLALVSNTIRPFPAESLVQSGEFYVAGDWRELLSLVRIDSGRKRLSFIPVKSGCRQQTLPGLPTVEILDSRIQHQSVDLKVRASCDCFLRLALSYYPWLQVFLDGEEVRFFETKAHFVYLRLPVGTHTIEVTARLTPIRRWTLLFSVLVLVACVATFLVPGRRRR